jgi:small redox-active disulfide protein 2
MALFKKRLKQEKIEVQSNSNPNARIKILGSGCPKCLTLEKNAKIAVENLNLKDEVTHITDMQTIVGYSVMSTPALVIDEKVVSSGKVLSPKAIESYL